MTKDNYLIFGSPLIEEPEIEEVVSSMRSGWLGTGPKVSSFEDLVKNYVGSKYAVALNSCTACLHLSLLVCGVGPGDEVITSPLTFCATGNSIIHSGATPVFVDVNQDTQNIDEEKIEEKISKKTKAIMPVHMAGRPCNMDKIMEIAQKYNLLVIEDAAHALGAEYKKMKIGSIADITCFSFYVTKNIITGEGGMITTDNKEYSDKIKIYGLHGMSKDAWKRYSDDGYKHYEVIFPGFKYNMTDMQAAIGVHQIKRIDKYQKVRDEIWNFYNENLADTNLILPFGNEDDIIHARHLYTVLVDEKKVGITRDKFMLELHKRLIGTGVHFLPLHLHKYYREKFLYKEGDYFNAEFIGKRTVSLPLSAKMKIQDAQRVIVAIKSILK